MFDNDRIDTCNVLHCLNKYINPEKLLKRLIHPIVSTKQKGYTLPLLCPSLVSASSWAVKQLLQIPLNGICRVREQTLDVLRPSVWPDFVWDRSLNLYLDWMKKKVRFFFRTETVYFHCRYNDLFFKRSRCFICRFIRLVRALSLVYCVSMSIGMVG